MPRQTACTHAPLHARLTTTDMDAMTDKFRNALAEESDFPLTDHIFGLITDNADTLVFHKGEAVVDLGRYDPDIYIIRSGIVRGYMLEQGVETNVYFGMEGTLVASMQSFSTGTPSIIRIEACCHTEMLRIRKNRFDSLMSESNEFCRWVAGVFMRQSCYAELKAKVMNGDARWQYEWLEKCRPELFDNVPLKAIASYLKMTQVHVSRIRKRITRSEKF